MLGFGRPNLKKPEEAICTDLLLEEVPLLLPAASKM